MIEGGRARRQTFLQRTTIWIPAGVIGLLMLPMAVTNRTFGDDWTLHLWLIRQQELNIRANGRPGLFLSASPLGVFYPIFAFVGSGLYTVGGYLAIVLGGRPILAYKLLYLAGLCIAYGGMTWLSWLVGLRGWRSQMPGLVLVTGAYFITDMLGRGDLGEFMAVAAIPFLLAAITAVTISSRLKPQHLLAIAVAVFLLTGSHNITLLFGTIFLGLLGLALLAAYSPSRLSLLPWRRLPAVVAAASIGVGLNAWYLLADLRYGTDTATAKVNQDVVPATTFSQWRLLLDPLRPAVRAAVWSHDVRVSVPWLFAAWAIAVALVTWRRLDGVTRRLIVLLAGIVVLYVYLVISKSPWRKLPHVLYNVQFTWRLHSYVALAITLLVMVALVWQVRTREPARRTMSAVFAVIAVFTVGAATWQAWAVPSTYDLLNREHVAPSNFADTVVAQPFVEPPSWYEGGKFRVTTGTIVAVGFAHMLLVPEAHVKGSTYTGLLDAKLGPGPFRTNIAAGPPFTRITGITPLGITESGFVVAERTPGTPLSGPVVVSIRQAPTRLLRLGAFVSMLSLAALALLVVWSLVAWLWPRISAIARPAA